MYEKTDATSFALDTQPLVRGFDFSADSLAALVCLTQLAFWTVAPSLVSKVPPMDALEGFMWGRQTVLLTYKHPQLPAWLMEIAYKLTGSYIWGGFLSSQVLICTTFGFVYVLGRDLIGRRAALAGVLLLPTTGFYNWGARQVNHDIVQLPFWAAICWLLWRAERENKLGWWFALGVVAGAGLYAKFSTGLLIGFGGLWLLTSPKARRCLATPRPWIALVVVLAFDLLLMVGMYRMNFIQLTYASARDAWRLPAPTFERLIAKVIADHLDGAARAHRLLVRPDLRSEEAITGAAQEVVQRLRRGEAEVVRSLIRSGKIATD